MPSKTRHRINRRHFLRGTGIAATAQAAVLALPVGNADAYEPGGEETRARYRETDHVKAFYRTNGYETLKK